jgi:hypothetical protein
MFNLQEGPVPSVAILFLAAMIVASCRHEPSGRALLEAKPVMPDEVGGWRAEKPVQQWDSESIFFYIDGHAEVYLAYGMRSCQSRRYSGQADEPDILVDLFEMASPADAYGVFTHDQDGDVMAIGEGALLRYGWLSFWKGSYFVSISAEDDTEASRRAVLELGRAVDKTISQSVGPPEIVENIPSAGLVQRSVRFLRSYQILNAHLYLGGDDPFGLGPEVSAVLARYEREPGDGYLLFVDYPDAVGAQSASSAFAARYLGKTGGDEPVEAHEGSWFGLWTHENRLVVVLAADTAETVVNLLASVNRGQS